MLEAKFPSKPTIAALAVLVLWFVIEHYILCPAISSRWTESRRGAAQIAANLENRSTRPKVVFQVNNHFNYST